jgi:tetratricopeptide (TPR) repeat protein
MKQCGRDITFFLWIPAVLVFFILSCASTQRSRNDQYSSEDEILHHLNMGKKYYENGYYNKAEREFRQVLERDPKDSDAHYMLGVVYSRQGQIEKGCSEFTQVLAVDENYAKAYYNLGALYANEGPFRNTEKASTFFKRYLELDQTSKQREKIERWLKKYDSQGQGMEEPNSRRAFEEPENKDFKEWLKEESERINE